MPFDGWRSVPTSELSWSTNSEWPLVAGAPRWFWSLLPSDLGELMPASDGALDFVNGHHHDPSAGKPNAAGCSQRAIATTAVLLRGPGVTSS